MDVNNITELSTKITFNELITDLNNNFKSLTNDDKEILKKISVYDDNKVLQNLLNGTLSAQQCILNDCEFKIGNKSDNSLFINNRGVALKISDKGFDDTNSALVIRVNGGDSIDLTNTFVNSGRVLLFMLGKISEETGYKSTIKYIGYGDNETTTFVLDVKQPSLILVCIKNDGTDNQQSFIRLTGTGLNDGSNIEQSISDIKNDIKYLESKTEFGSAELKKEIVNNTTDIKNTKESLNNINNTVVYVKDTVDRLSSTSLTTDNIGKNVASPEFVTNLISSNSARYLCKDQDGNPFPSKSELDSATEFYFGEQLVTKVNNRDVVLVLKDETYDNKSVRYTYNNEVWSVQYIVNDEPFTSPQQAAIDSGITKEKLSDLEASKLGREKLGYGLSLNNNNKIDSSTKVVSDKVFANINNEDIELAKKSDITDLEIELETVKNGIETLDEKIDEVSSSISNVVKTVDNQTISGEKTFNDNIILNESLKIYSSDGYTSIFKLDENGNLQIIAKNINLASNTLQPISISNVATPINPGDIVNKEYVDSHSSGVNTITTEDINNLFN